MMFVMTVVMVAFSACIAIVATVVPLFFVFKLFSKLNANKQDNDAIIQNGMPATAKILAMGQGGMTATMGVQRSIQMQLTLEIHGLQHSPEPYSIHMTTMVPEMALARVQPQQEIPVKVDIADRNRVAIDYAAMGYLGS